jgi:hypothetical protein
MDQHRHWHVRREGAGAQHRFDGREDACAAARVAAARCRSFRLFIETADGGFAEESAGWPTDFRRLLPGDRDSSIDPD